MDAGYLIRTARRRAGYSLRELAGRAGTSYSTLSDYERGVKVPALSTLVRIVEAAGFALEASLEDATVPVRLDRDQRPRGEQLAEVLDLAAQFPTRHTKRLRYPILRSALEEARTP